MTIDGKEDPGLSKILSFHHSAVVIKITYLKKKFYYITQPNLFPRFAFIKERLLQLLQVQKYNL